MWFIGLDVHWRQSSYCILDENGKQIKQGTVRGHPKELVDMLRTIQEPFAVCFEASCGYGWLHDALRPLSRRVVVAHPGQLRLIYRSKRKHDRIDAKKLAQILFLDQVPAVHVPAVDVRLWRSMIEWRRKLMDKRVAVKNALRALLRGQGVDGAPRGHGLWTKKGVTWMTELALPELAAMHRDMLLDELSEHNAKIAKVTKTLNRIAAKHAGVALLRTIPGVGPRTAEAVVAYVDVPDRFSKIKQAGTYFGIVPCEDSSAGKQRLGHITKEGPATARKLLIEAAWQGIRRSATIKAVYERIRKDDPDRGKIALVATARWLVCVMLAMLKSGEAWRHPQDTPAKQDAA